MRNILVLVPALALSLSACGAPALSLPDDPIDKAATCGIVAAASARSGDKQVSTPLSFDHQAQIVHYALLAGSADGPFSRDKAAAVVARMQAIESKVTDAKWQSLVAPCNAAFPEAGLSHPVALPGDPLQSQLACYMLGKFITKAMANQAGAHEDRLMGYGMMASRLDTRVAASLDRRGLKSETARVKARNEALSAAARLGPPTKVLDACEKRYE